MVETYSKSFSPLREIGEKKVRNTELWKRSLGQIFRLTLFFFLWCIITQGMVNLLPKRGIEYLARERGPNLKTGFGPGGG